MKELKYLKLFEAFESDKLSKTLGYISDKSRDFMIRRLREICNSIDFPFSQLSDAYFEYLPYHKALRVQYVGQQNPCKATSDSQFGSSGIKGEVCQSGKLKRMWGARQRIVDCPNCKGTGIQPEQSDIKLLKFWFTKEGEFVAVTGVDNTSKPQTGKSRNFSRKVSDYDLVGREINRGSSISSLEHGDIVLAKLQNDADSIMCFVYKNGRQTYLIQDQHNGDTPSSSGYRQIARYSWNITNGDFIKLQKAQLKASAEDDAQEIDLFSFNKLVNFGYRGRIEFDRWVDTEKEVNRSHFALVFDLSKLKKSEYKSTSDIKGEREELKSGSRLVLSDEDIKRANIERYMSEIAKRSDIINDISNLSKVVKRITGGEIIIFRILYGSRYSEDLSNLANNYLKALKELPNEKYYKENLSKYIADRYKSVTQQVVTISNTIKSVKEYCNKEGFQDYLQIVQDLELLSKKIYQKISDMPFECIEDIEIVKAKLDSLKQIFRSERYKLSKLDYFIDSLYGSNVDTSIRYLTNHYHLRDYKSEVMSGLKQAIRVVDRF